MQLFNRRNYIFFGRNLSQNIMVSIYVTLLQFFIREQMTHLGPHLGGGLPPLDLSVREGDPLNLAMALNCA